MKAWSPSERKKNEWDYSPCRKKAPPSEFHISTGFFHQYTSPFTAAQRESRPGQERMTSLVEAVSTGMPRQPEAEGEIWVMCDLPRENLKHAHKSPAVSKILKRKPNI